MEKRACRILRYEMNLKPGQSVIAGLHERIFAKTQVERLIYKMKREREKNKKRQ